MEQQVYEAIALYNHVRPHYFMSYLTPNQAHKKRDIKLKTYKRKEPLTFSS